MNDFQIEAMTNYLFPDAMSFYEYREMYNLPFIFKYTPSYEIRMRLTDLDWKVAKLIFENRE